MGGGVAAATYYEVITRYRVEDAASADLNRYTASTHRAEGAVGRLRRRTLNLGGAMRGLALMAGPVAGGMLGFAAVGYTVLKTFRNINTEINSTIQLAAQVNLAFRFEGMATAGDNFNAAMGASRRTFRELVKDAARLPGELSDFIAIAQQISGGVFRGGGNLQTMRALTARIALAAPAAGAGFQEAGLGAMQMLFGVARVTNPLFKMLAGQGLVPKAEAFNVLPAAERLRRLDDALKKLTDNPMFRKNILRTWDTQLGTLSDNLFGVEGILGRLMRGSFNDLLDGLIQLNKWLDRNAAAIGRLIGGTGGAGLGPEAMKRFLGTNVSGKAGFMDLLVSLAPTEQDIRERQINQYIRQLWAVDPASKRPGFWLGQRYDVFDTPKGREFYAKMLPLAEARYEHFLKVEQKEDKFTARDAAKANIVQNFHIKLDLKSDDAPDAVALKIRKAMEKTGRHPTTVSRGLSLMPTVAGAGP